MNSNPIAVKKSIDEKAVAFLKYLIENGGPQPHEYKEFSKVVNDLDSEEVEEFREIIKSILNTKTLIGHAFVKPFGYPGDFNLIHKIYQFDVNSDQQYRNWDLFFQNQPAANAVRNRKDYFIEYCKRLVLEKKESRVLILGSGPAEDVNEFLRNYSGENSISFELIDFDQCAIDFSMKRNVVFNGQITYNKINALRFNAYKLYDLIWSAGLFDYFKDKHFTFLIRKYVNCITDDGEMVISNFSTKNPTRRFMEVIDWNLNHRTESDLFRIAQDANIDKEMVSVGKEPLGINMFLKIRKNN
jgi:extracellular factor (EF) 3-hydroxypalmitic acid methyl ester biosynthesis protein